MTKAYRLMKHHDPLVLDLGKVLNQGLLRDSNNCVILGQHELTPLPEELRQIDLKEDAYLFEAYFAASADQMVTTDRRLIEKVATIESLNLVLRDEFLQGYLA
jgi:predicted nucleic acid-binding protein